MSSKDAQAEIVGPPSGELFSETDDNSVAILLTYGTARMLLAGDAEAREEEYTASSLYTGPLTDACPHGRPLVKCTKLEDLLREFGRL